MVRGAGAGGFGSVEVKDLSAVAVQKSGETRGFISFVAFAAFLNEV